MHTTSQTRPLTAKRTIDDSPNSWRNIKKNKYLLLLLIPGVVYFIIFHYLPMYGVLIAFKDFKMMAGRSFIENVLQSPWVGLENFRLFIESPQFNRVIVNTVILSLLQLIFGFPIPIMFALLLNEIRIAKYKKFVQTVSYLPHFLSIVATVGMLKLILSPSSGIVNSILVDWFGLEPQYFFGDARWFRALYVGSGIWQDFGFSAIIYLAALSKVDPHLYESAVIDGASRLQRMRYITLPALKTTIVVLFILQMGNMMSIGAEKVLLMYSPSTYETADVIATFVYRRGLVEMDYSFGAAVGLFNTVINIIFLVVANRLSRRFTGESLY